MLYVLALLSGVLTGIPFLTLYTWPLACVGMAPLFYLLKKSTMSGSTLLGVIFGFGCIGIAYYPVFSSPLPVEWAGFDAHNYTQYVFALIAWFLSVVSFALPVGLWALFVRTYSTETWRDFIIFPSAWMLAEFSGALLFSLFNYAPGIVLGAHFSISFLGNILADDLALRQIAVLGGVYALSGVVVAANLFAYRLWSGVLTQRTGEIVFAIALIAWGSGWAVLSTPTNPTHTVRVVAASLQVPATLNVSREVYAGYIASGRKLYTNALMAHADIILYPEGATFEIPRSAHGTPIALARTDGVIPALVTSGRIRQDGHIVSRMEYYDTAHHTTLFTYKYVPQPFGEYMGYSAYTLGDILGARDTMLRVLPEGSHVSGSQPIPQIIQGVSVGALFCNESLSPDLYRSLARDGAQIFLNVSSQDWFHESRLMYLQLKRSSQIRAAESHRPYVQSTNIAPSFALDAYGSVTGETAWGHEGILIADFEPLGGFTPYSLLGTWLLIVPLAIVLYTVVAFKKRQDRR